MIAKLTAQKKMAAQKRSRSCKFGREKDGRGASRALHSSELGMPSARGRRGLRVENKSYTKTGAALRKKDIEKDFGSVVE